MKRQSGGAGGAVVVVVDGSGVAVGAGSCLKLYGVVGGVAAAAADGGAGVAVVVVGDNFGECAVAGGDVGDFGQLVAEDN